MMRAEFRDDDLTAFAARGAPAIPDGVAPGYLDHAGVGDRARKP